MAKGVIQASILSSNGSVSVAGGASVEIRDSETNALRILYTDRGGSTTTANPVTADSDGWFQVYADVGRVKITANDGVTTRTWNNVVIQDAGIETSTLGTMITESSLDYQRFSDSDIDVSGALDYTLSAVESTYKTITLVGTLTANINVIVPDTAREYTFVNSTSGSFTITAKTSAGTGVELPQGELRKVRSDGTNVVTGEGFADFTLMPQVGGDPIVESGSNADGEWTRWADGTQICLGVRLPFVTADSAAGSLFYADLPWTYPQTFNASPNLAGLAYDQSSGYICFIGSRPDSVVSTGSADITVAAVDSGGVVSAEPMAFGYWK